MKMVFFLHPRPKCSISWVSGMASLAAAAPCSNTLLMADTYANVRKIESLVKALGTGGPYTPPKCDAPGVRPDGTAETKSP
jgi:hypothetical protein